MPGFALRLLHGSKVRVSFLKDSDIK